MNAEYGPCKHDDDSYSYRDDPGLHVEADVDGLNINGRSLSWEWINEARAEVNRRHQK